MSKPISPMTARALSGPPPGMAEIRSTAVENRAPAVVISTVAASTVAFSTEVRSSGASWGRVVMASSSRLVTVVIRGCDTPAQVIDLVQQQAG